MPYLPWQLSVLITLSYLPRFSCVSKCRESTLLSTQQLSWESGRSPSSPSQLLQWRLVFLSQIHLSSSHLSPAAQPTDQSHLLPWPTVLLASMCPLSSLPTCQSQQWASENTPINCTSSSQARLNKKFFSNPLLRKAKSYKASWALDHRAQPACPATSATFTKSLTSLSPRSCQTPPSCCCSPPSLEMPLSPCRFQRKTHLPIPN